MEELADWEDPDKAPVLTGVDAERQEWIRRINRHLRTSDGLEVVLEAFDLQHEWLQRHPGDMTMLGFGSSLARSWCWRGGDFDELLPRIKERRAHQARNAEHIVGREGLRKDAA